MSSPKTFVIVGASLAGAKAAEALRDGGFDGRVVLIGAEPHHPYERPPLSKGYLAGSAQRDSFDVHPAQWYTDHDIELRLSTRVTRLDPHAHEVHLESGETVGYTKALLTTGSTPRQLPVPGHDLDGVFTLRSVDDAEALRAALQRGGQVVVIGGGWIGLETAAAARGYDAEVTIIEPQQVPLGVLGPELGEVFAGLHRDHGVDLRTGTGVEQIHGSGGRVVSVQTNTGESVPAQTVIVGVGIRPNTELAEAAGLVVDNGIVVDELLQTTAPDVYAAGDVANCYVPVLGRHVRVEHWANALNGGPAAARSMLGSWEPYDRVPYFFSDQYELGMEYSGFAAPGDYDQVVYRGDRDQREFIAFWLKDNRVLAGMNVNVWDVTDAIQRLVRSHRAVDVARLIDPDQSLESLIDVAASEATQ